jgi:hypothetical protein
MQVSDLIVEVRDADLVRVGQITKEHLVGFTAVFRHKAVGSWSIELPVNHPISEKLIEPGAGIVVTTEQGTLLSGPVVAVVTNQSTEDPDGTYQITGVDDSVILSERLAYPTPTTDDLEAQTTPYDVRTGIAEAVIKQYVNANLGPAAPVSRRVANLTIAAGTTRGDTVSGSARFDNLQELITGLADVGNLGFNIEQVDGSLVFDVFESVDRSDKVRLDLYNGRLTKSEYAYSRPKTTRVIVGGFGDEEFRLFYEASNAESVSAETVWGRRIETFLDARSGQFVEELQAAADEVLVNDGKTQLSVSISPSDDQTMLFGVDWNLGDKVTVVVGSLELVAVVTEVGLLISEDGVRIGATVGEPRSLDYETQILTRQANAALRIGKLERTK